MSYLNVLYVYYFMSQSSTKALEAEKNGKKYCHVSFFFVTLHALFIAILFTQKTMYEKYEYYK